MDSLKNFVAAFFKKPDLKNKQDSSEEIRQADQSIIEEKKSDFECVYLLLHQGFTKKELHLIVDRLQDLRVVYYGIALDERKYLSKSQLADLIYENIKSRPAALTEFLDLVASLKPEVYQQYSPYPNTPDVLTSNPDYHVAADTHKEDAKPLETNSGEKLYEVPESQNNTKSLGEIKYQERQFRRQIRDEFHVLYKKGDDCDDREIIDFFLKYSSDFKHMKSALEELRGNREYNKPARLIWQLIEDDTNAVQSPAFLERKLLIAKRKSIQSALPKTVIVPLVITENGPEPIGDNKVHQVVAELLQVNEQSFTVDGPFPLRQPGEHLIMLNFVEDITIEQKLLVELRQDPMPPDISDGLRSFQAIPVNETDDILQYLQVYLSGASSDTLGDYFPRLSTVLLTAYQHGYWKTLWIQGLLEDWRARFEDYSRWIRTYGIKSNITRIIQQGPQVIPREKDTDELDERQLVDIARDILAKNEIETQLIKLEFVGDLDQSILPIEISINGDFLGVIHLRRRVYSSTTGASPLMQQESMEAVDGRLDDILGLHKILFSKDLLLSEKVKVVQAAAQQVVTDLSQIALPKDRTKVPNDPLTLSSEAKLFRDRSLKERADHFLQLSKAYVDAGNVDYLRFSLCQYCFSKARLVYSDNRKESRPYFLMYQYYYMQMSPELQHYVNWEYFFVIGTYFESYNIKVNVSGGYPEIRERLYPNLFARISLIRSQPQYESLGNCLCDIQAINPFFVSDLIHRIKQRGNNQDELDVITRSLREPRVFRLGPLYCIQILSRIDPGLCGLALSHQNMNTAEDRRMVVIAVMRYMMGGGVPPGISAETVMRGFSKNASMDIKTTFAFSLLIEPLISNPPHDELLKKECALKADLIVESLGLPKGIPPTEFFHGVVVDLASLFNKFSRSQDPKVKASYHTYILAKTGQNRRYFVRNFAREEGDLIIQLFRRIEAYATSEQSRLIRDTNLEIVLVNNRTAFSPTETRVTIEIRNVGEGIADGLELQVLPVDGKYDVEERHRVYPIDVLADKTPIQIDRFIIPKVASNEPIELCVELKYDTLEVKDKISRLPNENCKILLYPETQFVRIPKPYTIGGPATALFYGRHNLLENMADNLRSPTGQDTSMIVYGLKRTGKTSVVQRLITHTIKERSLQELYIPIYRDLTLIPPIAFSSDGHFLYYLKKIIIEGLQESTLGILQSNLPLAERPSDSEDFETFRNFLKAVFNVLGSKRLLLVLDEFAILNAYITKSQAEDELSPQLFSYLSNLIQSTNQIVFIFTGTYALYEMMRQKMQDIAKICLPYLVSYLDDESARQLIREPVGLNESMTYDPRVVDRIVNVTACHPYLIQYLCAALVDRMNNLKYNVANLADIDWVLDGVVKSPSQSPNISAILWDDLDQTQRRLLTIIAAKSSSSNPFVDFDEILLAVKELEPYTVAVDVLKTCEKLEDAQLIERTTQDDTAAFMIKIPIHELWLKHNKKIREVIKW
jgi:hypothetical protein